MARLPESFEFELQCPHCEGLAYIAKTRNVPCKFDMGMTINMVVSLRWPNGEQVQEDKATCYSCRESILVGTKMDVFQHGTTAVREDHR